MTNMTGEIEEAAGPLTQMGLTGYEARVLVALLKLGRATVREIYPVCGVPRSAVYGILERLRAKGLVHVASTRPTSYISVSPEEVMEIIDGDFEKRKKGALDVLNNINTVPPRKAENEEVWLLGSPESIVREAKKIILLSKKELLIGLYPDRLAELKEFLISKATEGVSICIIARSREELPDELQKHVDVMEFRGSGRLENMPEMSIIISDNSTILFSMKHPLANGEEKGFWSESRALISFFSFTLRMSMKSK